MYLRLARIEHPDLHNESDTSRAKAESRMQAVNAAWAVLSDPDERAAFDRQRPQRRMWDANRPDPNWRPFDPSDLDTEFDERHDAPITHGGLPTWLAVAPVMLFVYGLTAVSLGSFVGFALLAISGIAALVMSVLSFITAPLVALGRSRREDRLL